MIIKGQKKHRLILGLFLVALLILSAPVFVPIAVAAPSPPKNRGDIVEPYFTPTSTPTSTPMPTFTARPEESYTDAERQKMKEEAAIQQKDTEQKYEEYIKNRSSQSLTGESQSPENSGVVAVDYTPVVTPTPTPVGISNEELQKREDEEADRMFIEEMREEERQDYIKKGLPVPEDEIKKLGSSPAGSQVLTPHQMKKLYGNRKERYEIPPSEMIPDCLYTPGFRDPSICVDDNNNVIYKRGQGAEALENLRRRYGKN
jgi:hypothetical protein